MNSPLALIAELTHRCPLRCVYCSNPVEIAKKSLELNTQGWLSVIEQAAKMGVLQVSFTGGEPLLRDDLEELIQAATSNGLYTNLITSGVGLTPARCASIVASGTDHVQLSFQDIDRAFAKRISGVDALEAKKAAARLLRETQMAMTVNIVVHRENLERLGEMIEFAISIGAGKIEVAHAQFNGWATFNRRALLPTEEQVVRSIEIIKTAQQDYQGRCRIDFVLPDYYAKYPKACMGGWGQNIVLVDPQGRALPCHSAAGIPDVEMPSVRTDSLAKIWNESRLFQLFRGTEWMPSPCRECPRKETDFGGCRCQSLALTGDATNADPVCYLSPSRVIVDQILRTSAGEPVKASEVALQYRPISI